MKITADTNLLVRMTTNDDKTQARTAFRILTSAECVYVTLPSIVEFVWVLESIYAFSRQQVLDAVRTLIDSDNVATDITAVEVGLHIHMAGGDFADGVIASAGASMGADTFVSFDRRAVNRIARIGIPARHAGDFA
jgi:predicted nucleic-acid-binding protein